MKTVNAAAICLLSAAVLAFGAFLVVAANNAVRLAAGTFSREEKLPPANPRLSALSEELRALQREREALEGELLAIAGKMRTAKLVARRNFLTAESIRSDAAVCEDAKTAILGRIASAKAEADALKDSVAAERKTLSGKNARLKNLRESGETLAEQISAARKRCAATEKERAGTPAFRRNEVEKRLAKEREALRRLEQDLARTKERVSRAEESVRKSRERGAALFAKEEELRAFILSAENDAALCGEATAVFAEAERNARERARVEAEIERAAAAGKLKD